MTEMQSDQRASNSTKPYLITLLLISGLILAFSGYANLSWDITHYEDFQYLPPFKSGVDRNMNMHLGAEYLSIARAISEGRGFSDPFEAGTGATAWMPPVLCYLEAGLLVYHENDLDGVMNVMIMIQNVALIFSIWIILAICGQSARWWVASVFMIGLMLNFKNAFQLTHDCGWLMLIMNGVIAGFAFCNVFSSRRRAIAWGLYGGFATLSSPIIGFSWMLLSLLLGRGQYKRVAIAFMTMALVLSPWILRNYIALGKFIPVKSNLVYELYQSQCLQESGVLQSKTFGTHPWAKNNQARNEYRELGEIQFLEEKKQLFLEAVRNDPVDFLDRVAERFFAVTLIYPLHEPQGERDFPEALWATYLTYPLPFIGWICMFAIYLRYGLTRVEKVIFWLYPIYLMPYVLVSYYNRYEFPILMVKWVLIIWLGDRIMREVKYRKKRKQAITSNQNESINGSFDQQ
jgi:hypothetical protein